MPACRNCADKSVDLRLLKWGCILLFSFACFPIRSVVLEEHHEEQVAKLSAVVSSLQTTNAEVRERSVVFEKKHEEQVATNVELREYITE